MPKKIIKPINDTLENVVENMVKVPPLKSTKNNELHSKIAVKVPPLKIN